jgi:AraC-like DNA-binding protein
MAKTTTHYIAVLVRQMRELGFDVDKILEEANVPPELAATEDQWVDNVLFTALVKRMWRETGCELWGFESVPMKLGTWALACEFMLTAETLGDLYNKGSRLLSLIPSQSAGVSTTIDGDTVYVFSKTYVGARDPDHFLAEFIAVLWHRFPSWAIDENIQLKRVFFPYKKPPHGFFYEELFPCDVTFEQERIGFCFHKRYLNKRIVRSQAELDQWLRDSPADLMYLPGRETSIQSQIKIELTSAIKAGKHLPAFEAICSNLAMSVPVVRRRLSDEGTSYQQTKDSVRRDLAIALLSNPDMLIGEIAERTGFAEAAAFSHAFKKWTGVSPAGYRAAGEHSSARRNIIDPR